MTTFPLNQVYQRNLFLPFLRSFLDDFSQDVEQLYLDGKTQFANTVYRLGRDESLDLEVYEIHHTSSNDARVGIAKDAFKILHTQSFSNRALVVFLPEGSKQWRLSLLQIEAEINEKGRLEKGYSNPCRHSYLLGEGGSLITPQKYLFELGRVGARREGTKQLTAIEDLQSRFSVEALTKEFYNKLYNWYLWAVEPSTGVTFPNLVSTNQDDRDDIAIKIIRLITRVLFVWFIKQKGLVPSALFDENELDNILANFNPQSVDDGKYYNAILQNLFFATLNNEVTKRRFMSDAFQGKSGSYGVKTLFRDSNKSSWFKVSHDEVLQLFHNVPFMNCGLFECLDKYEKSDIGQEKDMFLDGFSSRDSKLYGHFKYRAFLPNKLFFAPEHCETVTVEENKKQKRVPIAVMGLIPLLKLYNFTVQENTPSDMEVSLDPELLGQVFENLLAAYNPETKESARKSTGSFYTPRPIVEYMVNESLIAYLKTKVPSVTEDTWRALISYNDIEFSLTEDERLLTLNALYECKILDPACGSGAFPMGMLQQMVHITRKLESEFDPYQTKLRIINNCIYGSDIQPIAMLISKLRFFISLICEQDDKAINFDDAANNFGINTLPNLETKFVAANSLLTADIHKYTDDNWTLDPTLIKLKNELLEIRKQHFSVRTQSSKLKKREEDRLKREEIYKYIIDSTSQPDSIKIQMYESRIKHLSAECALYEGEKIVEEYVSTQAELFAETEMQLVRKDVNKLHRDRIDAEIAELHKAIEKENNKRNPVGFNAAIKQIADWNPYDQLKFAPFFDPDWMFGIKDGFDIVIGNPPYFQVSKGIYSATQYPYSEGLDPGKQNMYKLFVEHSYNCAKENGVACMIVQSSLMCDLSSKHTRELLLRHSCLQQMIEFPKTAPTPAGQVFASVCQGTCIYLLRKCEPITHSFMLSVNNDCTTLNKMQKEFILQDALIEFYPEDYAIPMLKPMEFAILKKLKEEASLFSTHYIEALQGDLNLTSDSSYFNGVKSSIKLLRGKHIKDFYVNYDVDEFVNKSFKPHILQNNHKHKYLLCQQITGMVDRKRLHFALTDPNNDYIVGNSLNKILLSDETLSYFLMGLLNSQLLDWAFRKTSSNNHVNCYELGQLPIIIAEDIKPIEKIVKAIIAAKEANPLTDTSDFEKKLDNEVYNLYGLDDKERELIAQNYV
ncbi:MAG: N-6 DNA methylase [Paludibacteraceae bacterium]|nr:N-6 DNA methylase [Paludibacteraceae bacterium]